LDACPEGESGAPGLPLGMARRRCDGTKILRHNPKNEGFGRDRFLLSGGPRVDAALSMLHLTGYDLALDELKRFDSFTQKTPGHPENN